VASLLLNMVVAWLLLNVVAGFAGWFLGQRLARRRRRRFELSEVAKPNPQPQPDQIRRVITSYEAELPRWGVCIQMQTGELVQYGRFVTHERAKFERLALERMLFDGVPTPPPASFNAG
jgi:hypothetical protein